MNHLYYSTPDGLYGAWDQVPALYHAGPAPNMPLQPPNLRDHHSASPYFSIPPHFDESVQGAGFVPFMGPPSMNHPMHIPTGQFTLIPDAEQMTFQQPGGSAIFALHAGHDTTFTNPLHTGHCSAPFRSQVAPHHINQALRPSHDPEVPGIPHERLRPQRPTERGEMVRLD